MTLFLFTFFFLYSLLHLYAFLKAKAAIPLGSGTSALLAFFMLFMIAAPIIIRTSEKNGLEAFARILSYIGYTWLGVLLLFSSASILIDVWHLTVFTGKAVFKRDLSIIALSSRHSFYVSLLFSLFAVTYGYFEAKNIRTEQLVIRTNKLPEHVRGIRIVQISDVHIGLIVGQARLKNILKEAKKAQPDIILSTGDLVDGQINGLKGLASMFQELKPRYGKFAVTGNHEFYAGIGQAADFTRDAGFMLLRGKAVTAGGLINIAGIDDPAGKTLGHQVGVTEKELLSGIQNGKFTILLKHRPAVDRESLRLFDLQLSGHTHRGQIFPFSVFTWLYYPMHGGLLDLKDNHRLYVSRGAGTWGPPVRLLSPPEITIIDIVREF